MSRREVSLGIAWFSASCLWLAALLGFSTDWIDALICLFAGVVVIRSEYQERLIARLRVTNGMGREPDEIERRDGMTIRRWFGSR